MGNSFGHIFRVTTWGESHGDAVGVVVDGCPPRVPLGPDDRWWVHRPTSELQKTGAVYSMDSLHQQLSAPID